MNNRHDDEFKETLTFRILFWAVMLISLITFFVV